MDLYIDGSGVTVFDRDTALPVATFKRTLEKGLDGRREARRYVGATLVWEAAQELLRAISAKDRAAVLGAAHLLKQAAADSLLTFDVEDEQALSLIQKWADEPVSAPVTGASTGAPKTPGKKPRN